MSVSGPTKYAHRPHPGLYVVFNVVVVFDHDHDNFGVQLDNFDVRLKVPDHISFDDIGPWGLSRSTSRGPVIWWDDYKKQHSTEEVRSILKGRSIKGLWLQGIKAYTHEDGTPYDTVPFYRDRVGQKLSEGGARRLIDDLLKEDQPEDRLYAKVTFDVNLCDPFYAGSADRETISEFTVVVNVNHAEFDQVRSPGWWNNAGQDRISEAFRREYPKEYADISTSLADEMVEIDYDVKEVSFVDYFMNPVDTSSVEFQRKRLGQKLSEEDLPHPGLHALVVVKLIIDNPATGEMPVNLENAEWEVPLVVPIPEDVPWSRVRDWLDVWARLDWRQLMVSQVGEDGLLSEIEDARRSAKFMTPRWSENAHGELGSNDELEIEAQITAGLDEILGWVHADETPYDITKLEAGRVRGLIDLLPEAVAFMPHPGLHVIATAKVCKVYDAAPDGDEYWESCALMVPVPSHIPFEDIMEWLNGCREDSMTGNETWALVQEQQPDLVATLDPRFNDSNPPFIYFEDIQGYVHPDGEPYDVFPLQKDRVSRRLIDDATAHHPHPGLYANFHVQVGDYKNMINSRPSGSERWRRIRLRAKVPEGVPFENVKHWLGSWDQNGIQASELWLLTQAQYPNVAKNLLVRGEVHELPSNPELKTPKFYIEDEDESPITFTHADGTPYDTTPLQKDRVGRLLGD